MEKYFKTEEGETVNVIEHCRKILFAHPNAKILISTDSQNSKKNKYKSFLKGHTTYSTVIVFRYPLRGGHYIYTNIEMPKIKDMFKRLFKECELSLEIAEYITNNTSYKVEAIELDYAGIKITKSTPLISATKGWCESLGYNVIVKGVEMIAAKVADHCCRKLKV